MSVPPPQGHRAPLRSCRRLALQPAAKQHRPVLLAELSDAPLDLGAEVTHEALDGPGCGITQGTNSTALDLFAVMTFMV